MARRRKGQAINGWLVLDKVGGITSNDAVIRARRIFDAAKAGHAGTLDPLATGILRKSGSRTILPSNASGWVWFRFTKSPLAPRASRARAMRHRRDTLPSIPASMRHILPATGASLASSALPI